MKIKTEVLKSIYIITCDGPSLNPVLIQGFVSAMKGFIEKQQLDILLDLSGVESVDSSKLGSVLRFFDEMDEYGFLILCGVSDRVINLLKMTHLEENFIRAENRNSALSTVFWEKKKTDETKTPPEPKVPLTKKEGRTQPELDEEDEEIFEVDEYEIVEDGWEIVDAEEVHDVETLLSSGEEAGKKGPPSLGEVKIGGTREAGARTQQKPRLVKSKQISDDEIVMYCKNLNTGKHHTAVLQAIGVNSLLVALRPPTLKIGEELLMKGRLGRAFMLKEQAVASSCRDGKYELDFVDLSPDGSQFLTQLVGSVK